MSRGPRSSTCLNCGAPISGSFCAECGQRDIPSYPSVRELMVDAVSEFSGWDGRLTSTLRALFRSPGMLTREFLEGRRARYISPLRLYLTASLVYFVLAASAPNVRLGSRTAVAPGLRVDATSTDAKRPTSAPEKLAADVKGTLVEKKTLTPEERQAALNEIERAPALMQPVLRRAVADPGGFKRGLLETMPRMLFALLPIFAGIVALFYRGRKYPEHLYFAIHLHAFIFLALAVTELLRFTRFGPVVAVARLIVILWIPVYATLAFRRVYGGSIVRTLMKEVAIGAIHAVTASVVFLLVIYWVSIAG